MDPLSVAASAITLLGATGGTVKVVYDVISTFKDAPGEIKAQSKSLESFCLTIDKLKQVCKQIPNEFPLMLDLCGIEELIEEARLLEAKLKAKSVRVTANKTGRMRESCTWLLFDHQSKKFFKSLNTWNTILNQALGVAQLTFSQRIHEHTTYLVNLPNLVPQIASITAQNSPSLGSSTDCVTAQVHMNQGSPSQTSYAQKRQAAILSRMSEPVGMILVHRYHRDLAVVGFKLNGGRVILKRWSKTGEELKSTLPLSEGYSCSLVFMSPRMTRWSLVVSFSVYRAPVWPSSWNSCWNFRFRRTIPRISSCHQAITRGDLRTLQHQLSSGELRLTDTTCYGWSLLHLAVFWRQPAIVTFLLNEGVDANTADDQGRTPLHFITRESFPIRTPPQYDDVYECARRLLDNGADIMQQDMDGGSPLHFFHTEVSMKISLNYGEDIDFWMQDRAGMTILNWIAWDRRSPLSILPHSHQNTSGFSCLEIHDNFGRNMLHLAAQGCNVDIVAFLLASPYAATLSMPDIEGSSPLHHAVQGGEVDIIDLLLDTDVKMDAVDARGRTVLHEAVKWNSLPAARRLIERGASYLLAYKDCNGRTPLERAQLYTREGFTAGEEMVKYLQSLAQEQNCCETPQLESTEIQAPTPEIESTTPGVESTTPPLYRPEVSMVIVVLVLVVLFQGFLLWWHNSLSLHLGSSE